MFLSMGLAATAIAAENPDELYRQGKFAEAEEAYALLDMESPKDIRFRYNRGCAAYQNSDFQAAVASFTSVLRRTDNEKIKARTAYNLGNTAFKQGDFESAVKYYAQAIQHDPENEDAPYNFELALREREKQKAQEEGDKEQQSQEGSENQEEEKDGSNSDQDKNNEEKPEKNEGDNQQAEQEKPKDLSGELESSQAMPEQKKAEHQQQSEAELDKNKAEALLDNLKEDRSKFMQFRIPKDKRDGVGSGKDW